MALTSGRMGRPIRATYLEFTMASGYVGYAGAIVMLNLATGQIRPGASAPGYIRLGTLLEDVDASAAATLCTVWFDQEVAAEYFKNGAGAEAVAATDVGRLCYIYDDETVSILGTGGRAVAGVVFKVDSTHGVAVMKLPFGSTVNGGSVAALPAFVANDIAVTTALIDSGAVLTVPATGAASTITLPATATAGQTVTFVADGTNNGHTVQYVDATGPVNLTTALTASLRHRVECTFDGTIWYASAYIGAA